MDEDRQAQWRGNRRWRAEESRCACRIAQAAADRERVGYGAEVHFMETALRVVTFVRGGAEIEPRGKDARTAETVGPKPTANRESAAVQSEQARERPLRRWTCHSHKDRHEQDATAEDGIEGDISTQTTSRSHVETDSTNDGLERRERSRRWLCRRCGFRICVPKKQEACRQADGCCLVQRQEDEDPRWQDIDAAHVSAKEAARHAKTWASMSG
mmetsp:Transcript_13694/g.39107  ORF Transcript_13694/g.39107 Transcript_13694/m.39107 type:complete len:214 (-) Transcript_13694:184-825(-)